MTHLENFINTLGGRLFVAKALGISSETVRKWKYTGITTRAKVRLWELSRSKGKDFSFEYICSLDKKEVSDDT